MKEGAGSLYHPEILKKPATRPETPRGPGAPATGPGESSDRHFFLGLNYYTATVSIGIVLYHCQYSNSSSTPKVCYHPPEKTFHTTETIPAPCSLVFAVGPGGVTFWVTPSFLARVLAALAGGWGEWAGRVVVVGGACFISYFFFFLLPFFVLAPPLCGGLGGWGFLVSFLWCGVCGGVFFGCVVFFVALLGVWPHPQVIVFV